MFGVTESSDPTEAGEDMTELFLAHLARQCGRDCPWCPEEEPVRAEVETTDGSEEEFPW